MNTSFGVEGDSLIRVPATANLMIDSADRVNSSGTTPWNFLINKPNNLIQGFFTRVGVTEVVLDWCVPNISSANGLNTFIVSDISGVAIPANTGTITIPDGCYTMANLLDNLVAQLNTVAWGVAGTTFSVSTAAGRVSLACTRSFQVQGTTLLTALAIPNNQIEVSLSNLYIPCCADIRPYTYIDIVSSQLTAVQSVKDASTAPLVRDVLCRWYFDEDTQESYDAYGFPIYQGYKPFCRRRIFSPPKQIKWESIANVGQLSFQVYDNAGDLLTYSTPASAAHLNWRMTLQLSEA